MSFAAQVESQETSDQSLFHRVRRGAVAVQKAHRWDSCSVTDFSFGIPEFEVHMEQVGKGAAVFDIADHVSCSLYFGP